MIARKRLPNRAPAETFSFFWPGHALHRDHLPLSRTALLPRFLLNGKVNSQADTAARDSAVVASALRRLNTWHAAGNDQTRVAARRTRATQSSPSWLRARSDCGVAGHLEHA